MDLLGTDMPSQAEKRKLNDFGDIWDAAGQTHGQMHGALSHHRVMIQRLTEFAAEYSVPILTAENIDEVLGERPYMSHALISGERLVPILAKGALLSSKESGIAAMTYETDKLMGMDENVFLALGKGYMSEKGRFAFIFDPQKLVDIDGATFVTDDLMKVMGDRQVIENFLEKHKQEILQVIRAYADKLNEIFRARVRYIFQGGHGIYAGYFDGSGRDRVGDFLEALRTKSFHEVAQEAEIIDQYTILSDSILREDILPTELRNALIRELKEKVIDPNTVSGAENILREIQKAWDSHSDYYTKFLPEGSAVPELTMEIRIPRALVLRGALTGIYIPKE